MISYIIVVINLDGHWVDSFLQVAAPLLSGRLPPIQQARDSLEEEFRKRAAVMVHRCCGLRGFSLLRGLPPHRVVVAIEVMTAAKSSIRLELPSTILLAT